MIQALKPYFTIECLTALLVLITAFYAFATFQILKASRATVAAMKDELDALVRPYIVVSATPRVGTTLLLLRIRNSGRSPASEVRLTLDRDFYVDGRREPGRNLRELAAFSQQIDSLPPDSELQFVLGTGAILRSDVQGDAPSRFTVSSSYSWGSHKYEERNEIDMRPWDTSVVPQDAVAEEIKHLTKELAEGLKKLRAN